MTTARRFGIVLMLGILSSTAAFVLLDSPLSGIDDANIFFVYARNLVDGEGLVFNPGGERVEGFSSPAWLVICAAVLLLVESPEWPLVVINLLLLATSITVLVGAVDRHLVSAQAPRRLSFSAGAMLVLAWAYASPAFVTWSVLSLMETGLWSALLVVTTVAVMRLFGGERPRPTVLSVLVALLVLTRPEGMVWGPFFVAASGFALSCASESRGWRSWRPLWAPAATYVVVMAGLTLGRLSYFGYPLPNTYYAKVSPHALYNLDQGLRYALKLAMSNGAVAVFLAAAVAGFVAGVRELRRVASARGDTNRDRLVDIRFILSATVLFGLSTAVVVGGDHFASFKSMQPLWPLMILPAWLWATSFAHGPAAELKPAAVSMLVLLSVLIFAFSDQERWHRLDRGELGYEFELAARGRAQGTALNELFGMSGSGSLPSAGVIAVGGFAWRYRGRTVDLMALNDPLMAHRSGDRRGVKSHAAFDAEVLFLRDPDLLLPAACIDSLGANPHTAPGSWSNRALKGLLDTPRFRKRYLFAALGPAGSDADDWTCTYVRRDIAANLGVLSVQPIQDWQRQLGER